LLERNKFPSLPNNLEAESVIKKYATSLGLFKGDKLVGAFIAHNANGRWEMDAVLDESARKTSPSQAIRSFLSLVFDYLGAPALFVEVSPASPVNGLKKLGFTEHPTGLELRKEQWVHFSKAKHHLSLPR
jgi:hypothetical protein